MKAVPGVMQLESNTGLPFSDSSEADCIYRKRGRHKSLVFKTISSIGFSTSFVPLYRLQCSQCTVFITYKYLCNTESTLTLLVHLGTRSNAVHCYVKNLSRLHHAEDHLQIGEDGHHHFLGRRKCKKGQQKIKKYS